MQAPTECLSGVSRSGLVVLVNRALVRLVTAGTYYKRDEAGY